MPQPAWSEQQSIHLPEIDAEHRSLHLLASELKRTLARGAPAAEIHSQVRALLAELEDHFTHEERMMHSARYAMSDWHKSQHDAMRKRAREYAARIQAGNRKAGKELVAFTAQWLRDHMAVADNMMGAALRNHRRSHAA
jgi:hemerythrin-like metal-binding protein